VHPEQKLMKAKVRQRRVQEKAKNNNQLIKQRQADIGLPLTFLKINLLTTGLKDFQNFLRNEFFSGNRR
jgi:hypothetical protein